MRNFNKNPGAYLPKPVPLHLFSPETKALLASTGRNVQACMETLRRFADAWQDIAERARPLARLIPALTKSGAQFCEECPSRQSKIINIASILINGNTGARISTLFVLGKCRIPRERGMQSIVIISPRRVRELTSLSPREQTRRASQGRFPKPIRLGQGPNGRKGFVEAEILEWNAQRVAERDGNRAT